MNAPNEVEAQEVIGSLQGQIAEQALKIAVLEAQIRRLTAPVAAETNGLSSLK